MYLGAVLGRGVCVCVCVCGGGGGGGRGGGGRDWFPIIFSTTVSDKIGTTLL